MTSYCYHQLIIVEQNMNILPMFIIICSQVPKILITSGAHRYHSLKKKNYFDFTQIDLFCLTQILIVDVSNSRNEFL